MTIIGSAAPAAATPAHSGTSHDENTSSEVHARAVLALGDRATVAAMGDPVEAFCRSASLAVAEPLAATATADTDTWFILEYRGVWAAKAWPSADMPADVRAHVDDFVDAHPRARIQLVRRAESRDRSQPELVLASSRPGTRAIAKYCLNSYEDLLGIDFEAAFADLLAGEEPDGAERFDGPMLLVCTNGKRDRCCAKWGVPIFDRLAKRRDLDVWQTTHVGGHRYAPTLLCLPDGLMFGRVDPSDVDRLVDGLRARDLVDLSWYRGRTSYSEAAQAIEHAVRVATGALGFDDVAVEYVLESEGRVQGRARHGTTTWHVELAAQDGPALAMSSCGKMPEPVRSWRTLACTPQ